MKVVCMQCKNMIDAGELPKPQIINTPGVSLLVLEHPKRAFCIECKSDVAVTLLGANLQLGMMPIGKAEQSPIIMPAGGPLPKIGRG